MPEADSRAVAASVLRTGDAPSIRLRWIAWLVLPVIVIGFWIALAQPLPFWLEVLVPRLAYGVPVLLTVFFTFAAALRSRGMEHRFWALLGVANLALFLSEASLAYWLLFIDPNGPPRIAFPFQFLHLVAAIAFLGVLASMTRFAVAAPAARLRYIADVAVFALVLYVISLELYVRPLMEAAGATTTEVLIGAAYPVVAFLMLFGTLGNVFGFKVVKWRSWEKLLIVALAIYVGGVMLWPAWWVSAAQGSRNEARSLLDLVQLTGHYVLMMAAVYRLTEGDELFLRPLPPLALTRRRWLSAGVPLISLGAVGVVAIAAFRAGDSSLWPIAYGFIATCLMALVLTRSALLALEHSTLFHRSITDPLTGLYNHRYFHDRLADEFLAATRFQDPLAVIVLDIDDFGELNARHGHSQGDLTLARLADLMLELAGESRVFARIGGDEFGLILPETDAPGAALFAQRMLDRIDIEGGSVPGSLSASAGVAVYPDAGASSGDLFHLADCAMLWAKQRGKNRVVVYEAGRVPDLSERERIEHLEKEARLTSVRALAAAVDARDAATRNHSQGVATLAQKLGRRLGLDEDQVHLLGEAALMHDVGKIGVPDAILSKPGPLTAEERTVVEQHPILGQSILAATELTELLPWIRAHHERWDGRGYPDGLEGEEIPLEARILAVCDAFEAMTSDRPYRQGLSMQAALQEIDLNMRTQFDPLMADALIQMVCSEVDVIDDVGMSYRVVFGDGELA